MINRVILIGRLVKDAEINQTSSGIPYTRFTIAVARQFVSSGDNQTDFAPIVAWRNTANFVTNYTRKGSLVAIEGRFSSYSYTSPDGLRNTRYEIVADNVESLETKEQFDKRIIESTNPTKSRDTNNPSLTFANANEPRSKNVSNNYNLDNNKDSSSSDDANSDLPWEIEI